jgi:hypothetical protein
MTIKQVDEAHKCLESIEFLHKWIESGVMSVEFGSTDWAWGCAVDPSQMAMVEAARLAKAAARGVMDCAARQQIKVLENKLADLGLEIPLAK